MTGLVLLLALQAQAGPLVGDTVWLEREVEAPTGSLIRPLPWEPGEDAQVLGPPEAVARPGGWTLRYPVAFWRTGTHRVVVPGPLLVRPDGSTDSLPGRAMTVLIGSVLPAGRADTIAPRPAAGLVTTATRSPLPALALPLLAALLLAPLHWWWRRRGPAPVARGSTTGPVVLPVPAQLEAWAAQGELRLAADGWIARLESAPASPERDQLLAGLRAARFDAADQGALAALCREAAAR